MGAKCSGTAGVLRRRTGAGCRPGGPLAPVAGRGESLRGEHAMLVEQIRGETGGAAASGRDQKKREVETPRSISMAEGPATYLV